MRYFHAIFQVVSQRAPHYFALSVLPSQLLEDYVNSKNRPQLVKRIFSIDELNDWQYNCHLTSLKRYVDL